MTDADRKRAIELIRRWRKEDPASDLAMWPIVKAALNQDRIASGARPLFPCD